MGGWVEKLEGCKRAYESEEVGGNGDVEVKVGRV